MNKIVSRFLLLMMMVGMAPTIQAQTNAADTSSHFFVLGDWGKKGKPKQKAVAQAMINWANQAAPRFIALAGDNFYTFGVGSTTDKHWKKSFENVYAPLTQQYDWLVALGNHDYMGNPQAELDYHSINPRWILPQRYYTKVIQLNNGQTVRLLFIDTSPFVRKYHSGIIVHHGISEQDTLAQKQWIDSSLAVAKEDWKIVIGHHPIYSCDKHGNTNDLAFGLKPLLEKHKVHLYLAGHSHNLQHSHVAGEFTHHVVSGGGSEATKVSPNEQTKFAIKSLGFINIIFRDNVLQWQFINEKGAVLYTGSRNK
jgi:tartrate-resistant acid phosphatase type 5